MNGGEKIASAITFGICILWLIATITILGFHWFLTDPIYTVHSYNEVIRQEIQWGLSQFFFETVLLFFPTAGILISVTLPPGWTGRKRMLFVFTTVIILSVFFTVRDIQEHLINWQPLELSTRTMKERTFEMGRTSFIPMKQYTLYFSVPADDASFISDTIVPTFTHYGYQVSDFMITVGRRTYTSVSDPLPEYIFASSIDTVPLHTSLALHDFSAINFSHSQTGQSIDFGTDGYEKNHIITGRIRTF